MYWLGSNLSLYDKKNYCGIRYFRTKRANIIVQNADLLIILGSHLCLPQTGVNTKTFSPKSKKI